MAGADESENYRNALTLKDAGRYHEAIRELESILESGKGRSSVTNWLIAALHLYELDNAGDALPFAESAVDEAPRSERASICLVHCLFEMNKPELVDQEIRRFVATGSELREYELLFEENGLSVADYR